MKHTPVRILHVIGIMNRGGAETMIMNLYRHMDRSKVQFDFVENSSEPAAFDEEITGLGGRIYRCPHYNGKNHFAYKKWWKRFFNEHAGDYAAVHGHLGSTASIYLSIAKKYGLFTIAHSHNTTDFSLRSAIYSAYSYPTRHIADYFFGCSEAAGLSRFGRSVCRNPQRFTVLKNAIETEKFAFSKSIRKQVREEYHIEDRLVIGHVGRFFEQKNHRFLVEIFAQIHQRNPSSVLMLVGDGELRDQVEEQIQRKGLSESVIFTGVQADVSRFYQAMDVFVFPSLYEGLGIAAVEAQCSGLPCVVSDGVPKECIVTTNLVTQRKLSDSVEEWASHILEKCSVPREDHSLKVTASGYDIGETSRWLEEFYLTIG